MGGSPDEWSRKPYVWVLWCCVQLRQRDRIRDWVTRMQRWELAYFIGKAWSEPEKFCGEEKQRILDDAAAGVPDADWEEATRAFDEALAAGRIRPSQA